jgi:hypothetical protein
MSNNESTPVFTVDGIQSAGVHNGLARVLFMRLGADGKPLPAVELNIPADLVQSISQAIGKVK